MLGNLLLAISVALVGLSGLFYVKGAVGEVDDGGPLARLRTAGCRRALMTAAVAVVCQAAAMMVITAT